MSDSLIIVFVGMDFGVICLGVFIGVFIFKEKISKLNVVGIGLGVIVILCMYVEKLFG